jgi:hypothetical protein
MTTTAPDPSSHPQLLGLGEPTDASAQQPGSDHVAGSRFLHG